jgi:hypothetical protein
MHAEAWLMSFVTKGFVGLYGYCGQPCGESLMPKLAGLARDGSSSLRLTTFDCTV